MTSRPQELGRLATDKQPNATGILITNAALIGSLIVFLVVVGKIASVSRVQITTALALAQNSNPGAIILGAILDSYANFIGLAIVAINAAIARSERVRREDRMSSRSELVLLSLLYIVPVVVSIVSLPWPLGILIIALVISLILEQRARFRAYRSLDELESRAQEEKDFEQRIAFQQEELEAALAAIAHEKKASKARFLKLLTPVRGHSPEWELERRRQEIRQKHSASLKALEEQAARSRGSRRTLQHAIEHDERASSRHSQFFLILFGLVVAWAVSGMVDDDPWLPAEQVTTKSDGVFTAYVLADENDIVTLMRDKNRMIVRMDKVNLLSRSYCRPRPAVNLPTLGELFSGRKMRPSYPRCP